MSNNSPGYFVHESSYIDENVIIGEGTKIWHFSHIQSGSVIGERCSLGQNVNIANNVKVGNNVKIQNNVSVYEGVELEDYVFCGPSMVFTNVTIPRSEFPQRGTKYYKNIRAIYEGFDKDKLFLYRNIDYGIACSLVDAEIFLEN